MRLRYSSRICCFDRSASIISASVVATVLAVLLGLPAAYSGQNALGLLAPPLDEATTVVVVGGAVRQMEDAFADCREVTRLGTGGLGAGGARGGLWLAASPSPALAPATTFGAFWCQVRHRRAKILKQWLKRPSRHS
mgnify:CR=1 FL=1